MKARLINNLEFARKQSKVSQKIDIKSCERLLTMIEKNQAICKEINYTLTGTASEFHLPSLRLQIKATLPVLCQRCLQVMQLALSLNYQYVIAQYEPASFEGGEEIDWLEISHEMNVNELVEDELLMAIPLGPSHQYACKALIKEDVEKLNPFAVLKRFY